MFLKCMKFSRDAARLGYEVQTVMTVRLLKFARGGKAAKTEARRMVAEKGVAGKRSTVHGGGKRRLVIQRGRRPLTGFTFRPRPSRYAPTFGELS